MAELCLAAQAAGAHPRALAKIPERRAGVGYQAITHIIAAAHRREKQLAGRFRGNVLHAVDSQVDALVEQRFFEFLDEDAFAANLRQRRLLHFVAGSLDDDDFGFHSRKLKELLADKLGLPAREDAAS